MRQPLEGREKPFIAGRRWPHARIEADTGAAVALDRWKTLTLAVMVMVVVVVVMVVVGGLGDRHHSAEVRVVLFRRFMV